MFKGYEEHAIDAADAAGVGCIDLFITGLWPSYLLPLPQLL